MTSEAKMSEPTGEKEIARAAMQVLAMHFQGKATIQQLIAGIPSKIALNEADLQPSQTRPGEPMWHQIVRNMESHRQTRDSPIRGGLIRKLSRGYYQITSAGLRRLDQLGLGAEPSRNISGEDISAA